MSNRNSSKLQPEDYYQRWQEVKAHQKDGELKLLKQKLTLQHKLIHAYDTRSHQLRQELTEKQAEEREAQRREKKHREEALVKKWKESTDNRKSQTISRRKSSQSTNENIGGDGGRLLPGRPLSAIPSREGEESSLSASLMSEGGDTWDISGDDTPIEERVKGWDHLPSHEQELYRLFGLKEAECFLYPESMPEKRKVIHVPNSLRKQGGRAGTDPLWLLLRNQTHLKLEQADKQIPAELRKAYSAYIREYLAHTKPAARRHFYTERDLPLCERMEDSHYHEHIREIRHRMELMYRSSLTNKDKTNILLHNNPLPDFNDINGEEGIHRYHPSLLDMDQSDSRSDEDLDYKQWLPPIDQYNREDHTIQRSKSSTDIMPPAKNARRKKHRSDRGAKLSFLTEEKAQCESQFWKNHRNPDVPDPTIPGRVFMADTTEEGGHGLVSEERLQNDEGNNFQAHSSNQTADSMPTGLRPSLSRTKWQPLSISALGDHRPSVDTQGSGDYRFGRPTTWKPVIGSS